MNINVNGAKGSFPDDGVIVGGVAYVLALDVTRSFFAKPGVDTSAVAGHAVDYFAKYQPASVHKLGTAQGLPSIKSGRYVKSELVPYFVDFLNIHQKTIRDEMFAFMGAAKAKKKRRVIAEVMKPKVEAPPAPVAPAVAPRTGGTIEQLCNTITANIRAEIEAIVTDAEKRITKHIDELLAEQRVQGPDFSILIESGGRRRAVQQIAD